MSVTQATDDFLGLLEKSQLFPPDQLAQLIQTHALREKSSGAEIAKTLYAAGVLTRFQAERLLEGRYRGFFFDHYKVLDVLGCGGMGWLYTAEDPQTHQKYALKVLSENYKNDPGLLARFELEASAGIRLNHPNTVRTCKVGQMGDVHFMVMEFTEGINLYEIVALQGKRPWAQCCDLIMQVAAGLQHLHEKGVIHRDVKPANVLVQPNGGAKILDFGLAMVDRDKQDDEFSLAMIFGHNCLGTADYIAPEQVGDSFSVDARADVYSLGCTMYFALTAGVPFPCKSNSEKLESQRSRQPRPLRDIAPEIPAPVAAIVDKMMAKDPAQRYQSAREVEQALAPFAQRQPLKFDFGGVVNIRANDARQRALEARRKKKSAQPPKAGGSSPQGGADSSSVIGKPETSPPEKPVQSSVETLISADTQPDTRGSNISLNDPFDTRRDGVALLNTLNEGNRKAGAKSERAPLPSAPASLVPFDGGDPVKLTKKVIAIGRGEECDIQISSPHVSTRHCELRCVDGWWRIIDLKSKNGVRVNGTPVTDHQLWSGDQLTVARHFHFRIEYEKVNETPSGRKSQLPLIVGIVLATSALAAWLVWKYLL